MRDSGCSVDSYRQSLKTYLFSQYYSSVFSALEVCNEKALYKFTLDIDIDM